MYHGEGDRINTVQNTVVIETFPWSCAPSPDPIQTYVHIYNRMIAELAESRINASVPTPFPHMRGGGWE